MLVEIVGLVIGLFIVWPIVDHFFRYKPEQPIAVRYRRRKIKRRP